MEYQKIQTLFKRDEKKVIIPTEFTLPEFGYLKDCKWEATEKIDGTNMRVELFPELDGNGEISQIRMQFKGRTDSAMIPAHLYDRMTALFDRERLVKYFYPEDVEDLVPITIFGEGYGAKIQKGGNYIKDGVDFILFDVKIGKWWLSRESCEKIATDLGLKIVPLIGMMTIQEAIDYVKQGFKSTIAENKDYDAEGLVLKTPNGLLRRNGERLVTKIKTVDFRKYESVYGSK